MYYAPDASLFIPEEIFPPSVIAEHLDTSGNIRDSIWRLMDGRILSTIVDIRRYFNCPIYINNYRWGGSSMYRGYRPVLELVDFNEYNSLLQSGQTPSIEQITPRFSSFTSQHCLGRAIDFTSRDYSAKEIRQDMRANPYALRYQYITAVEDDVDWVHIDSRNWFGDRLFF